MLFKTKRIKLSNVSSNRGAPMGRGNEKLVGKCRLQVMVMVDGDYDQGGAYWGGGRGVARMWVAEDSEGRQAYVRGWDRVDAKNRLLVDNEGITFYR